MTEIFICGCGNTEHQLIFSYNPDFDEVFVSVFLHPETNILKRIWNAIKYVFGHRSKYGYFDEFIFNQNDAPKLAKILKYLDPTL